jgi:hypothetical protein
MKLRILLLLSAFCLVTTPMLAEPPPTPYAGQQNRTIRALSEEDIAGLLKGEGMGMAKAAELNGYPGPVHVLALAKELGLTADQLQKVTAVHDRMSAAAKPLGAELVEHERVLDQLFAKSEITPERLAAETAEIGELNGRLRLLHLAAHLETRALLNSDQIARYQHLRGYAEPSTPMHHHHS